MFSGKKKSYSASVPMLFNNDRISEHALALKSGYSAQLNGDKEVVSAIWYKN